MTALRYQAALVGSLANMELVTLQYGRVLEDAACTEFKRSYLTYRCSLNWLATEAVNAGKCRYHMRPKVHQMAHLVFGFLPLNPRRYSKYSDEDYICKTKKVAQMRHPLHMSLHTAMRYSVAACLRWHNGDLS